MTTTVAVFIYSKPQSFHIFPVCYLNYLKIIFFIQDMQKWHRLQSEIVYDSKHFRVKKDLVELPNGEQKEWTYWDGLDSAMVLAMTEDKKLVIIRQYRYMVDDEVIEFPSGKAEGEESIEDAAKREFEEETGYICIGKIIKLGSFYETYGQLNRKIHLFFTDSIAKSDQKLNCKEKGFEDIEVVIIDFESALQMALENKTVAMGSALAILLFQQKIKNKEIEP